jgi:hypothetical protein
MIGGAVLVVVLAVVLFSVLTGGGPTLTYAGDSIDQPEETLTSAERSLRSFAEDRHGATNDNTRCYFALRQEDGTDVRDYLRCGPVLFVDGNANEPYLTFPLEQRSGEGNDVRLVAADEPESEAPERLPRNEELRRPDDQGPPDGSGGLEVPPPPRAEEGFVDVNPLDRVETEDPGPEAAIGSVHIGVRLTGIAQPDRFGEGVDARRPAEGEKFVAAQVEVDSGEAGDILGSADVTMQIQVDEEDPVAAPEELLTPFSSEGLIVSVPEDAEQVFLLVNDGGTEQRIDLVTGDPGGDNITVLRRENREQALNATANLTFAGSIPGFPPVNFTVTPTITNARLVWWYPPDGSGTAVHPESHSNAYMVLDISYLWDPELGAGPNDGLGHEHFSLRLPSGEVIAGTDVDGNVNDSTVVVAFGVPGDFTEGTIVVGGRSTFNDVTFDFGASTMEAPVSIPAG